MKVTAAAMILKVKMLQPGSAHEVSLWLAPRPTGDHLGWTLGGEF